MDAMREFLADAPPVRFDNAGVLKSAFPFTVCLGTCPRCHGALVLVCGLTQCPSCPEINDWLIRSRRVLAAAHTNIGRTITIEIVP